ncbi:MAG: sigma 54-interacting transcriptional regulator [Anaerolineae bacterium]
MKPGTRWIDPKGLQVAWKTFTASGLIAPDLDPLVAMSWRRCAPRVNPHHGLAWQYVSNTVLPLVLKQHDALITVARPLMEDTYQCLEGVRTALVLADSTACVLEMQGDFEALSAISEAGGTQGAYLSESHIGTNAFALALEQSLPAMVVGAEHFVTRLHEVCTFAAPVYDPTGAPVGVIGFVERLRNYNPRSLGTAAALARAIENQLNTELFLRETHARTAEMNATLDAMSEAMIAWNDSGFISHMNAPAGELLGVPPVMAMGHRVDELPRFPALFLEAMRADVHSRSITDLEVQIGERMCLANFRVISSGAAHAFVVTIRPLEQVRRWVNQFIGSQAGLTLADLPRRLLMTPRLQKQAQSAASADGCALITGEVGVGKNPLARAIHNTGPRASAPFVIVNCRALLSRLALMELLGVEGRQVSRFELAERGTLLFEGIEDLPLEAQSALSQVIESGEVIRLNGNRIIPVDVRIIATSHADLSELVERGAFNAELFFRLRAFVFHLPALREQPAEIPELVRRIVADLGRDRTPRRVSEAALAVLRAYPWPGNVREMESVIEQALSNCDCDEILPEHLPEAVRSPQAKVPNKAVTEPVRSIAEAERVAILTAGRAARGNLGRAAQLLGIGRTTLWRRMKELGLRVDDFEAGLGG